MKIIAENLPLPMFPFPFSSGSSSSVFILSESFVFLNSKNFYEYFIGKCLPTFSLFAFSPNARWIAYQDLLSWPLFNADQELTSDATWLVAQEGTAMTWQKIRKIVRHSFSHNFSFCFFLLVSYSFILLAFIQLNPKDFLLPQVHLCSCLLFSIYLHSLLLIWSILCLQMTHMFPPPLSSHLKVFFHDSFSKSTLLCASFSVNFFWTGVWLLP